MATAKKSAAPRPQNRRTAPPQNVRRPAPQPQRTDAPKKGAGANGGDPLKKIGALWSGVAASGTKYFSGVIDGVGRVVVFKNSYKEEDSQPTLIIYLSREGGGERHAYGDGPAPEQDNGSDDIPF